MKLFMRYIYFPSNAVYLAPWDEATWASQWMTYKIIKYIFPKDQPELLHIHKVNVSNISCNSLLRETVT